MQLPRQSLAILINTLAVFGYLSFIGLSSYFLRWYKHIPPGWDIVVFNEAIQVAINLYFTQLESLCRISIVIIGLLLAFIVYEGYSVQIQIKSQIHLFIITVAFLIVSFIIYIIGHNILLNRLFSFSTIDLEAPMVKLFYIGQLVFFILGIVWFFMTTFLCLKQKKNNQKEGKQ